MVERSVGIGSRVHDRKISDSFAILYNIAILILSEQAILPDLAQRH
jgi:hypothetical protein